MKKKINSEDKKVTIYDVAREADVSLATVSRVINGSNVVKAATRDRVLEVIERLDFKPNEIARGLAKSKTTTIAVVFPESLFAHVNEMIGGIGDTSRSLKYSVSFHTTDDIGLDTNAIEEMVGKLVKSRADGVILFNSEHVEEEIEAISKYKIPVVVIGSRHSGDKIGSIFTNTEEFFYTTTKKYLDAGKSDICYVKAKQNLLKSEWALKGMNKAFEEAGLDNSVTVVECTNKYEECEVQFLEYFKDHKHDLILCNYDKEAVAVINGATENGINVPEEMEVIGLFNTTYALMSKPKLSSVAIPVYNTGALAVRLLTKILNNEPTEKEIQINSHFIPRSSTKI